MRFALLVAGLLAPSVAAAHAVLTYPPPRDGTVIKDAPCGGLNTTRGTNITTLSPGATITIQFKETIDHPGHYRISFDNDGQDFMIPADATSSTEGMLNVVKDLIPDIQGALPVGGRPYTVDITLPNVECNNCTLQMFQMMTDAPPYTTDAASDDIYYSCADITLAANAPDAGTPVNGGDDAGVDPGGGSGSNSGTETGGCSAGGNGAELPVALALLGFVGLRRRRRSV